MAVSVDQFGKALVAAGLYSADEVKAVWNALPAEARPKDGPGFARLLVEQHKLNEFQARQLLAGKGHLLVFGEYVVLDEIGSGGMGQVYKAEHRRMRRIVALKVMSQAAMKDQSSVKRFQREVEAAARLEHPNIVTAFDAGRTGEVNYLVMQFVDGGDLSELVKKNGPLPVERAVDCVLQAARGLSYAHGAGVIHRDIKPANLLCDKKGVVKILDMGLARIESGEEGLTATEQVMGTVDYMSPEQASNTKSADARSDVYSLGCTLWYLLTGRKTYDGDSMVMRLMAHRDAPLPSLMKAREDVPWALEQVFHKMIAKQNVDRYQTMDEVAAALEPFAAGGGGAAVGMGSSIGMGGGPKDAELSAFFKTVGPSPKTTAAKPSPAGTTAAPIEATAKFNRAEADTDPKSDFALAPLDRFAKAIGVAPAAKPQPKPQAVQKPPPNTTLIAAGAGGAALLLLALWFLFRGTGDDEAGIEPQSQAGISSESSPAARGPAANASGTSPLAFPAAGSRANIFAVPPPPGDYALTTKRVTTPLEIDLSGPLTFEAYLTPTTAFLTDAQRSFHAADLISMRGGDQWSLVVWTTNGPRIAPTTVKRTVGRRAHVAAVYTPQEMRLYVDGTLAVRHSFTGAIPNKGRKPLEIGKDLTDRIDEIRVSKSARYVADFQPAARFEPDADTLLLYHCDEGAGEKLFDASGNGRDGWADNPQWVRAHGGPISIDTNVSPTTTGVSPIIPAASSGFTGEFIPLFNGRDLTGWTTVEGKPGRWTVVDGALTGSGPLEYLFTERNDYDDFHLRAEVKVNDKGNGGIYFRGGPERRYGHPSGFEAQINSSSGDAQRTGSLYNIARYNDQLVPPDTWFTLEIIAEGPRIRLLVNGRQTVDYTDPQGEKTRGPIVLQHHDEGTQVAFRKIEIKTPATTP